MTKKYIKNNGTVTHNAVDEYALGIDFGTDSVRTLIIHTGSGDTMGEGICPFPRWEQGLYCDTSANQFRQHPLDYLQGLESSVREALSNAPKNIKSKIKGLTVATTGSTPVAVDQAGTPLAMMSEFSDNPNAMFLLWKDHAAIGEAEEINKLCQKWRGPDYRRYIGGTYSSEWFWAKLLHVMRVDSAVKEAAFSWVEHCDWITAELIGDANPLTLKRSRCAAGHKAMWHPSYDGLPADDFLVELDPLLKGLRDKLYSKTYTSDTQAGRLSETWAKRLGLPLDTSVGVGALDAHMGAVGAGIKPYSLVKVIGTSTCDMLIAPHSDLGDKVINGICGQVDGSIVPDMLGMEAGQSAFGDVYAWFKKLLLWPVETLLVNNSVLNSYTKDTMLNNLAEQMIPELSRQAQQLPIESTNLLALDWLNGRRTPDANQALTGAIAGLNLGSDAPRIFRAFVEATAFGAKRIVERFTAEGVAINEVIALGGVAKKSPFVMQVLADVLGRPIKVSCADQACALGAAMCASVAAGIHDSIASAQQAMGRGVEIEYQSIPDRVKQYDMLYKRYIQFGKFIEKNYCEEPV